MWAMDEERDSNKEKISSLQGSYEFRDVRFHYPDDSHPVLNGLNLKVEKGETVALVGESGSGKSTVLNMLIGFYHPSSGTVLVDGKDMNDLDLHVYRSHIATVPQTSVLFSGTIRENIVFGMENCTQEQIDEAIHIANLENVIAKLPQGLDTNVGEHGDKLSGGQRQRIAIARAVIRNASVIIFDEATSALDTVSEKLIQESLDRLAENRTTFIVAHRLSTIRNADKIAVIKDGKCVEFGTWDELMALGGEFYKFRNMQA
jgi:ATP-binding cassette subfamily B protein